MSYHDQLTELFNRTALTDFGEKLLSLARREQKEVSVMFLDLSKFKEVNDKYGHGAGDQVLKIIAKRLTQAVRGNDLVARFGGDEFIIFSYDVPSKGLDSLLDRIFNAVQKPIEWDGEVIKIGVHIGIATFPRYGETLDELIRKADVAMYRAKQRRLSAVFYADEI